MLCSPPTAQVARWLDSECAEIRNTARCIRALSEAYFLEAFGYVLCNVTMVGRVVT